MEKDAISVTSAISKHKGGMGRHSTEERTIRGSPSSSTSSGKPLPNYLRASTGSCHDFCKHGNKHAFEEESNDQVHHKPFKTRIMGQKQLKKEHLNEDERRKKGLVRMKDISFQSRIVVVSDKPEVVNRLHTSTSDGDLSKEKPESNEMLLQEEIVLNDPIIIHASSKNTQQEIRENMHERKTQTVKPKGPVGSNASKYKFDISTEINEKKDILPDNVSAPQRKSIATKEKNISGVQKATASTKPRLVGKTSLKNHSVPKPEIPKKTYLAPMKTVSTAAKPDITLKAIKTSSAMPESPVAPLHGSSTTRKDGDKTSRYSGDSKMVEKKGLKPSRTFSPKMINRSATTTKNKGDVKCKQNAEKVKKNICVSEMEPNDADMNSVQNEVQKAHIAEELPLPENTTLNSLEKELLTPQNVNTCLMERENIDLDSQHNKSNNEQEDKIYNGQKKQQTSGGQSFPSILGDKEEHDNRHQQQDEDDDQSSQSVLDSIVGVADMNYLQNEVQKSHSAEELLLPENTTLNSLEKEHLTPQNVNTCLMERENVDLDCQQRSNIEQEDENDNGQKKQQTSGGQSFPSILDDKEHNNRHQQQDEDDDQSSQSVLDRIGGVADMNYLQNEVQKSHIAEELLLPENITLNSLEKELLTQQNVNTYLMELENVDLDYQQISNIEQEDVTDNGQKKQQTSGGQSFPSILDDKEEHDIRHQQQDEDDDQSSQSVLDCIGEVADCHQQNLSNLNQTSEDAISSQPLLENCGETDNFQQHTSSDSNQMSTDDHSASDYEETDETDSGHTQSGSEVGYEESESSKNEERRLRRSAVVHSEDNYSSPHKLQFKRGKVIELQPESNGPKKLRFRRAREASGGDGGNHGRRHLQRNEMDDMLPDDLNPQSETVVLRHKDAQEKKDSQGLFNNVIEETASKLVESRKSKVKALVGAFETVISLQDGKPASTT